MSGLPILELEELCEIFEYSNRRTALKSIKNGNFPVPVFPFGRRGRLVAHVDVVAHYFNKHREEGLNWIEQVYGVDPKRRPLLTEPRLDLYQKLGSRDRASQQKTAQREAQSAEPEV